MQMPDETRERNPSGFIHFVGNVLDGLSGEYLLTHVRYPNGGTVVFLRALHVTAVVFLGTLAIMNALDPTRGSEFSWTELGTQTLAHTPWIGAIFATVYALLYARFASQWTYLAGVYNQIKAAQLRDQITPVVLAEWKAGFIEDCDDLHLLRKPMFASIANEWITNGTDKDHVVKNLNDHAPGGEKRLMRITSEVATVVKLVQSQYK
jgi:hypothetical protein